MTSREQILAKIKTNQPSLKDLPILLESTTAAKTADPIKGFTSVLLGIGGAVIEVKGYEQISEYIKREFKGIKRIISTLPELHEIAEQDWQSQSPHSYENIDLAILKAHFGVAENAALWLTEELMHQRAIPFICQQLAVVVKRKDIIPTMHDAYARIGNDEYGFGAFIAGPSKTADIEQSLVLGAHGPKGMTVFIID